MEEGAVYTPLVEIVPVPGLRDHVTLVFVVPLTLALNCWDWEAQRLTLVGGFMATETALGGVRVTVAEALPFFDVAFT